MTTESIDCGSAEGAAHPMLVTVGAPILRTPSKLVEDPRTAAELCEKLTKLMFEIEGAGLAAPQIGVPFKVMCFQMRPTPLHPNRAASLLYAMVNPTILDMSDDTVDAYEGCFSIPGYMGLVPRARTVKVRYWTADGEEHCEVFEESVARVIQHECDHLEGFVYVDRMRSLRDFVTKGNYMHFELYNKAQMK